LIFSEHLSLVQWAGVAITLLFFYLFSLAGKSEGIHFSTNKWVVFLCHLTRRVIDLGDLSPSTRRCNHLIYAGRTFISGEKYHKKSMVTRWNLNRSNDIAVRQQIEPGKTGQVVNAPMNIVLYGLTTIICI
jgi:hypothetical protein